MKRISLLTIISIASLTTSLGQNQFYDTWYVMDRSDEGSRERMVLSQTGITTELLQTYEVDEPYWKIDKETSIEESRMAKEALQIVGQLDNAYFGGEIWAGTQEGELKVFQMREQSNSIEEAFDKINKNEFKELMARTLYSKKRLEEIQKMPTLSTITKEDLIATIEYVRSYSEVLNDFVNKHKDTRMQFWVGRFAENLRDSKLIELGYHPYKWVEGETYYADKFKDDPDIQRLNEASIHLKLF